MSSGSRRELLARTVDRYRASGCRQKSQILTEFVEATGYSRKHAIRLLSKGLDVPADAAAPSPARGRPRQYSEEVHSAIRLLWETSCRLCAKRLVPFLPELVAALERHGRLELPESTRSQVLAISAASVDRLLAADRRVTARGQTTTRPGGLLRSQIAVRTHLGWEDSRPGYCEADTVGHSGGSLCGSYLLTLVVTDIATGWIEFEALPDKTAASVAAAMDRIRDRLPFALLGLDTDNGSEFINELLYGYCQSQQIEFTRGRAYQSNDQAHVEQKNGSVIRRLIGFDRFEGQAALEALSEVYVVLRLFQNYFQPSMKLLRKHREDGRVIKTYDAAKTPYQRLRQAETLTEDALHGSQSIYAALDPMGLRCQLQERLTEFWRFAWERASSQATSMAAGVEQEQATGRPDEIKENSPMRLKEPTVPAAQDATSALLLYRKTRRARVAPVAGERIDFTDVREMVEQTIRANPHGSTKKIYRTLQSQDPERFPPSHLRTFYRRLSQWRRDAKYKC